MSIAGAFGISLAITAVMMAISVHKIDEGKNACFKWSHF